jgi:hypothetical protein
VEAGVDHANIRFIGADHEKIYVSKYGIDRVVHDYNELQIMVTAKLKQ